MRHTMLLAVLFSATATLTLATPSRVLAQKDKPKVNPAAAPYVHVVIFHVKKDAPEGTVEALIKDSYEMLAKIPTVRTLRVGRPADKATDIAKKDYQLGLMILFDNYEGLKTYLDHPKHLEYVEKHGKHLNLEQLKVYDFNNQKK